MDEKTLLAKIDALEKEVTRLSRHTDAVEVQNLMSRYIFYMENGKIARSGTTSGPIPTRTCGWRSWTPAPIRGRST